MALLQVVMQSSGSLVGTVVDVYDGTGVCCTSDTPCLMYHLLYLHLPQAGGSCGFLGCITASVWLILAGHVAECFVHIPD